MVDLSVKIGKLKLKNPVMVASGTFGVEYRQFMDMDSLGAIITKTITLESRMGNKPPRVAETSAGMINSIGLENSGLKDFIEKKIPAFPVGRTQLIASIAGDDEAEFAALAKGLNKVKKISALEINLSCPNVKHGTREGLAAQDEKAVYEIVRAVRKVTDRVLIAKLSPCVTDITKIAKAAESAGADAISLINTYPAMAVDIDTARPNLGNVTGGLSGPAIKPIALKMVWDTYGKIKIPIIGIGGIMGPGDAIEFMLCGASAVQVGTASFVDPSAAANTVKGIKSYMEKKSMKNTAALTGKLKI